MGAMMAAFIALGMVVQVWASARDRRRVVQAR
jgi:DHA1 family bicyclomycin/chloramphenicol resistance-like MFS transporter